MRRCLLFCLAVAGLAAPATAAVPSPTNSIVPCVRASLSEGLQTLVIVRDIANVPLVGSTVVIDLSDCPGFTSCPLSDPTGRPPDYTWDPDSRTARMNTWIEGRAAFFLAGGGTGGLGTVRVYADGVLLATRALFSPDQDGDLFITGEDETLWNSKLGTADPTGDLDCDGVVTTADTRQLDWWGRLCVRTTTSAHRSSWGSLKTIYR